MKFKKIKRKREKAVALLITLVPLILAIYSLYTDHHIDEKLKDMDERLRVIEREELRQSGTLERTLTIAVSLNLPLPQSFIGPDRTSVIGSSSNSKILSTPEKNGG